MQIDSFLSRPDPFSFVENPSLPPQLRSILRTAVAPLRPVSKSELQKFMTFVLLMVRLEADRMALEELGFEVLPTSYLQVREVRLRSQSIQRDISKAEIWRNSRLREKVEVPAEMWPIFIDIQPSSKKGAHHIQRDGLAVIAALSAHELEKEILRQDSADLSSDVHLVARLTTNTTLAAALAISSPSHGKRMTLGEANAYVSERVQQALERHQAEKREIFAEAGRRGKEARLRKFELINEMVRQLLPSKRGKSLARTARDICDELMQNSPPVIIAPRTVEKYIKAIEAERFTK